VTTLSTTTTELRLAAPAVTRIAAPKPEALPRTVVCSMIASESSTHTAPPATGAVLSSTTEARTVSEHPSRAVSPPP
jgi:hypothetical protein